MSFELEPVSLLVAMSCLESYFPKIYFKEVSRTLLQFVVKNIHGHRLLFAYLLYHHCFSPGCIIKIQERGACNAK